MCLYEPSNVMTKPFAKYLSFRDPAASMLFKLH